MLQLIPIGAKLMVLALGALIVLSPVSLTQQNNKEVIKMTQYRGIVIDQLTKDKQVTKWYSTYKDAHDAAEKLSKRTIGDRGSVDVEVKDK